MPVASPDQESIHSHDHHRYHRDLQDDYPELAVVVLGNFKRRDKDEVVADGTEDQRQLHSVEPMEHRAS